MKCHWCGKESRSRRFCFHCGRFQLQKRYCWKHDVYHFTIYCPKCRDEALPVQHSRGKNKLFKS